MHNRLRHTLLVKKIDKSAAITDPEKLEKLLVCEFFNRTPNGFFIEVGANDPEAGSQTYLLEKLGWNGILVEPQSELCKRLREHRPKSRVVQAACSAPGKEGEADLHIGSLDGFSTLDQNPEVRGVTFERKEKVKITTLDEIVKHAGNPKIDFLSIDVEGMELDVLRGFSFPKFRPALLLIEDTVRSLEKHHYLETQGYVLVKRTGLNNWYVPKEGRRPRTSFLERLELLRKMYLATPLRQLRLKVRRRSRKTN